MSNYSDQIKNENIQGDWVGEINKRISEQKNNGKCGGFFDLPKQQICNDQEHEAPKHICIPQGKGYRHICPKCGRVQEIIPPQITL